YLSHQREMLRALAGLVTGIAEAERRLAQVALDAPSLGHVTLLTPRTPADRLPQRLAPADVVAALGGREVASALYFREDLTPAMDVCVPAGATAGTAVCATLDLLELQRQVQRIRIGESGFALAFDAEGRLLAAGAPALRANVLTGTLALGAAQSRRVLDTLETEERWRTAGRIATGISHDLGHRLAILQSTAALAEANDPAYLPLIRDNLRAETGTLKKFVADFADLSREVSPDQLLPLDLHAFAHSTGRTAIPHAEKAGVHITVMPAAEAPWVNGDRYLLERAALNLLSNAIEAAPRRAGLDRGVAAGHHGDAQGDRPRPGD